MQILAEKAEGAKAARKAHLSVTIDRKLRRGPGHSHLLLGQASHIYN